MVKKIIKYNLFFILFLVISLLFINLLGFIANKNASTITNSDKNSIVDSDNNMIELPIIMYHSLLKDEKMHNDYTISPDIFEEDLKYLKENGYKTILVNDLINYVYSDNNLPEKCIMLTFDDGNYNNYYYAYPMLKKYDSKAIISPIASMVEKFSEYENITVTYGTINSKQAQEMVDSGYVEIQNHSYDLHKLTPRTGVDQKKGESFEEYKSTISKDITKAQNYIIQNIGTTPSVFVYPFGAKNEFTEKIVKELGFKCTMNCTEKLNYISKNPESLYELGRFRRDGKESIESLLKRIYE